MCSSFWVDVADMNVNDEIVFGFPGVVDLPRELDGTAACDADFSHSRRRRPS